MGDLQYFSYITIKIKHYKKGWVDKMIATVKNTRLKPFIIIRSMLKNQIMATCQASII